MKRKLLALAFLGLTFITVGCDDHSPGNSDDPFISEAAAPGNNGGDEPTYNDGTGGVWIPGEGVVTTGDSGVTF